MLRSVSRLLVSALLLTSAVAACNTYRDQLSRGERAYTANDHERTLAILSDLELEVHRLSPTEQAQYAWLRGMADYRIGDREDARHWLAIARAMEDASPGILTPDAKRRATEALDELNTVVYTDGAGALSRRSAVSTADRDRRHVKQGGKAREQSAPKSPDTATPKAP